MTWNQTDISPFEITKVNPKEVSLKVKYWGVWRVGHQSKSFKTVKFDSEEGVHSFLFEHELAAASASELIGSLVFLPNTRDLWFKWAKRKIIVHIDLEHNHYVNLR